MVAECLPAAAKRDAISSPTPKPLGAFGWLVLYRNPQIGRERPWVIGVPKKVIPTSVRRSRLKRLIREALRALKAQTEPGTCWKFSVRRDPPAEIRMADVATVIKQLIDQNKC